MTTRLVDTRHSSVTFLDVGPLPTGHHPHPLIGDRVDVGIDLQLVRQPS